MKVPLKPHPNNAPSGLRLVEVQIERPSPNALVLNYFVTGQIDQLSLPSLSAPTRTGELWKHTCFEAFLRTASGSAYFEFNFSPSTQWATYEFKSYREAMRASIISDEVNIETYTEVQTYRLKASVDLNQIFETLGHGSLNLGLSAVIEERSGRKSYWALAHPPGQADFHHSDCFAHELEPYQ
jgi:hypothetical protein